MEAFCTSFDLRNNAGPLRQRPVGRWHCRPTRPGYEAATKVISRSLRRTQETQVLQAITAVHLNRYAFDWKLVESLECSETQVPRLFHSSRTYSLLFDVKDPDGDLVVFRPGVNQEESTALVVGGWLSVLPYVQAWADRVKEAIDTENRTGSRPRCQIARADFERTAALSSRGAAKILGVSATTLRRRRAEASRFSNR